MEICVKVIRNNTLYKIRRRRIINILAVWMYFAMQNTDASNAEDICSAGDITATSDLRAFFSPNFPNQYPNNLDCETTITSPPNTFIEVEFFSFHLEDSEGCTKDFLKITDKTGGVALKPSCGASFLWPKYPDKVVSLENDMTVTFTTDNNVSGRGFNATIRTVRQVPNLLVVAETSTIRWRYRNNGKCYFTKSKKIKAPLAVDYDPRTQYIFYSDRGTKSIVKFHVEKRFFEDVLRLDNISVPRGLRIDVHSRVLYWTDAELGTISVSNLDGDYRNTLIETDLEKPDSIVTEPYEGYIYFTDLGTNPKIERAEGDGQNRLVLVHSELFSPRSLAIDLKERVLYWINSAQNTLERVKFDGSGRQVLKRVPGVNIDSLALDDDAFFWSGSSHKNKAKEYLRFIDRKLEFVARNIHFGQDKYYNGISLRPYQESGVITPGTCPTTLCSGLCLPKVNGHYRCLTYDVTPPVFLNCPDTVSEWAPPGKSSTLVFWKQILLNNDYDFVVSSSHVSGTEFSLGSEVVSIAAKDVAGNKAWCNFSVIVEGYTESSNKSLTLYLIISIGGVLIVLVLAAVSLQVVYVNKRSQRNESHSQDQTVDSAPVRHNYWDGVLISGGSVGYTQPQNDAHYTKYIDAYEKIF